MAHILCSGCDVHSVNHNAHDTAVWFLMMASHRRSCEVAQEVERLSMYKDQTSLIWGREHWRDDLQTWQFSKQGPWRFRWVPGQRGIWIFVNEYSESALCCIPLPPGEESTKENAIEVSKAWVRGLRGWGTPAWDAIHQRLMRGAVPYVSAEARQVRRDQVRKPARNRVADKGSIHDGGIDIVAALCSIDKRTAEKVLRRYWPEVHVNQAVQDIAMALALGTLELDNLPITVNDPHISLNEMRRRSETSASTGTIFDE